ncbi:protein spitz-like isoform X1 [Centruroides sculpturatus]|uniref:protein spitz-like isoform X1 n=1 Tax=Centruroides sculpturatus TaxID=218467 RepID=UPI000C6CA550|nr:protein spitz-like isoform X1 [Centruroides sculpturatus]
MTRRHLVRDAGAAVPGTDGPLAGRTHNGQSWLLRWPLRTPVVMPRTTCPPLLLLVLLASALFRIAGACSSRSTPKPRPPTATMRPNITFQTYTCPEDYAKWYCLNGATCFFVRIGESILYNCECADGFVGQRCEFKDLAGSYLPVRKSIMIERASIAGGVSLAVVIIVVISIVIYVYVRRREKEKSIIEELERKPFGSQSLHSSSDRQTTPTNDLESGSQPGTSTETPLRSLPILTMISQGRNQ